MREILLQALSSSQILTHSLKTCTRSRVLLIMELKKYKSQSFISFFMADFKAENTILQVSEWLLNCTDQLLFSFLFSYSSLF